MNPRTPISRPALAWKVLRTFGTGWVATRAGLAVKHRTGWLRAEMPVSTWEQKPLARFLRDGIPVSPEEYGKWRKEQERAPFLMPASRLRGNRFANDAREEAERILAGEFTWFSRHRFPAGSPPDWHRDPFSGIRAPAECHWSEIDTSEQPDIKLVWELGRFGFAFALARAYAGTGEDRFAEGFWKLFEDWRANNPPNRGPHWMCGQEATFRLMALCFAAECMKDSPAATPVRQAALTQTVAVTGERIEKHISYALSQHNNHGLSEATGLFTIGTLFPELREADRWREKGQRILEREVPRQIYDDGAYIQHSINYHRVMLDVMTWAIHLGETHKRPFSQAAKDRVVMAARYLVRLVDPKNGHAPNLGHNDGAWVLPLAAADFRDLRPSLQTSYYLCTGKRLFPEPGSYDEPLLWFFGEAAVSSGATGQIKLGANSGGEFGMQGEASRAVVRCARFHDRPTHADQLHVDLWWRGENIAIDAGTFLYNGAEPWRNTLASAAVHNSVTVDGEEPMTPARIFLWLDWDQGRAAPLRRSSMGKVECFEGEREGYERIGVRHQRAVVRCGDAAYVIVDDLIASDARAHSMRLHWLLPDLPWTMDVTGRLDIQAAMGEFTVRWACNHATQVSLAREGKRIHGAGEVSEVRGWRSLYYADKEPALSLAMEASAQWVRFVTVFDLANSIASVKSDGVTGPNVDIRFAAPGSEAIITSATYTEEGHADSL